MTELFSIDRTVITKHLKNIFTEDELDENSVCAIFAHTAEDGKAYQKSVMIGQRVGDDIVIQKGLKPGDEVVVEGQEKLANGRSVRVMPQ